jgi:nucleoside-diphosphate-sugar epimerase
MVEGLYRLLMSSHPGPMNLGNSDEMSLLEMARQVIRQTASKSRIVFRPLPTDDPRVRQPDTTLARKVVGWRPTVSLERGLSRTVAYFRERVGRGRRR